MFSSIWVKLSAAAAVALLIVTGWLFYNHAIKNAEDLQNQVNTLQQAQADLTKRVSVAEASQMQEANNLKKLSDLYDDHQSELTQITSDLKKRQSYIQTTYKAATNEKKSALNTDLSEYHCVFDGTCKAPVAAASAVPGKP